MGVVQSSSTDIVENGKIRCDVALRSAFGASAPMPEPIAVLHQLKGEVSITNPNKPNQQIPATEGMCLYQGDTIITGDDAAAEARYPDGGMIALGTNYSFEVDQYNATSRPDINGPRTPLGAREGRITAKDTDRTHLPTPATILGVRG